MTIKELMNRHKIQQWKIARYLNINEFSFSRKLRDEPEGRFRRQIIEAIEKISGREGEFRDDEDEREN